MAEKKPTIRGLQDDLRSANAEARRYLDQLGQLREENARLKADLFNYSRIHRIVLDSNCSALVRMIRGAQANQSRSGTGAYQP